MGSRRPILCHLKLIVSYSYGCRRNFQDTAGRYVTQISLADFQGTFPLYRDLVVQISQYLGTMQERQSSKMAVKFLDESQIFYQPFLKLKHMIGTVLSFGTLFAENRHRLIINPLNRHRTQYYSGRLLQSKNTVQVSFSRCRSKTRLIPCNSTSHQKDTKGT